MQHRTCGECLFFDICDHRKVCCDFYPADDNQHDVDEIIDEGRNEFYDEWFRYISEYE